MRKWVMLVYDVPNKPSSKRLYVWRKLKKIGAVSLQDAVFVLPFSPKTMEQMQWLAAEITEMDGKAFAFLSDSLSDAQDEALRQGFLSLVRPKYVELLSKLVAAEQQDTTTLEQTLPPLLKEFLYIRYYDHLKCDLGFAAEKQISKLQTKMNAYKYGGPPYEMDYL